MFAKSSWKCQFPRGEKSLIKTPHTPLTQFLSYFDKKIWQRSLRMKGNIQFHFVVKDVSLANKNATCLKQKRNSKLSWYYKNIDTDGQNVFYVCSISIKMASTKPAKARRDYSTVLWSVASWLLSELRPQELPSKSRQSPSEWNCSIKTCKNKNRLAGCFCTIKVFCPKFFFEAH